MPGSTNFQVFNPTAANQESDAQYTADPQRVGGGIDGQPFPSETANKLFYQVTTGMSALMDMMAAKGFNVSDANRGTLASVLAAIQTTADSRNPLQNVSYAATLTLNAAAYSGFQIQVSGPVTINFTGQTPGQQLWFMFTQDSTGGHAISIPSAVGEVYYDTTPNSQSQLLLQVVSDNSMRALTPGMGGLGLTGTPVGQSGTAQNGTFARLIAAATTLTTLAASGNITGSALIQAAVALTAPQHQATIGTSGSNGYAFVGDTQTGMFSSAAGTIYLLAQNVAALVFNTTGITIPLGTLFQGLVTLNAGATINGNIGGNPAFTGTPSTSVPSGSDNSARIPTTSWVQSLISSAVLAGFAASLTTPGYIKFPTALGGLILQWGTTGNMGGGNTTPSFPITFPNACYGVQCTALSGGSADFLYVTAISASSFTVHDDGAGAAAMWLAYGR
jgi:hypothetical protein